MAILKHPPSFTYTLSFQFLNCAPSRSLSLLISPSAGGKKKIISDRKYHDRKFNEFFEFSATITSSLSIKTILRCSDTTVIQYNT